MSFSASLTTPKAVAFASGFAGLPPSLPLVTDELFLRSEVLPPRKAACFFVMPKL